MAKHLYTGINSEQSQSAQMPVAVLDMGQANMYLDPDGDREFLLFYIYIAENRDF